MPPHLHPRSRMTSSLFASTVVASFLVVGLPHILPCPAPRVAYADASNAPDDKNTNGNRRRVRRRSPEQDTANVKDGIARFEVEEGDAVAAERNGSLRKISIPRTPTTTSSSTAISAGAEIERGTTQPEALATNSSTAPRGKRECPVPKPGGVIGELMGFRKGGVQGPEEVQTPGKESSDVEKAKTVKA
ncbi:hypothetical protein F5Y17DRAFT_128633 [Xylariaceae sp. FL0594]|nr:hypothetical protein F5Y17DRAFT_128633 [Xylariaceae sp. FL0594]